MSSRTPWRQPLRMLTLAMTVAVSIAACTSTTATTDTTTPPDTTATDATTADDGDSTDPAPAGPEVTEEGNDDSQSTAAEPVGDVSVCSGPTSWDDLANDRRYNTDVLGSVEVSDGGYQGDGGTLTFLQDTYLERDLNDDCHTDAVFISWENGGGSGSFFRLRIMVSDGTAISEVNTIALGDRVTIDAIEPSNDGIELTVTTRFGETDTYTLTDSALLTLATLPQPNAAEPGADAAAPPEDDAVPSPGRLSHQEIQTAIARDEPNIAYLGSCSGAVVLEPVTQAQGATPFCGTILSEADGEAIVELAEEFGVLKLRLVQTVDGWQVDWAAVVE